jgi:hypothetical protein
MIQSLTLFREHGRLGASECSSQIREPAEHREKLFAQIAEETARIQHLRAQEKLVKSREAEQLARAWEDILEEEQSAGIAPSDSGSVRDDGDLLGL